MSNNNLEQCDVIVVGGNLAGLFLSYQLGHLGYRTVLVEKSPWVGGTDQSFTNANGRVFDFGLHVLDYMRSEMATRLFQQVLDDKVRKVERKRAIVLRNHIIPYNAPPADWPDELRSLMHAPPLHDDIGGDQPSRARIAECYGTGFADFIYDEALPALSSEARHLAFGVDEAELLTNIYPWFFPAARKSGGSLDRSHQYQDSVRKQPREYVLYPEQGGFGAFARALVDKMDADKVEVLTGVDDLQFELDPDRTRITHVAAKGRRLSAPRVLWCAPAPVLMELLEKPAPAAKPDRLVLGSFEFNTALNTSYNEFLLADAELPMKRMSLPAAFSGEDAALIQIEQVFPQAEQLPLDADHWRSAWLEGLKKMGLIDERHEVLDFDFKAAPVLFNAYGSEGVPTPAVDFSWLPADSNILPVYPTLKNVNINTRLPRYLDFLARELASNRGAE